MERIRKNARAGHVQVLSILWPEDSTCEVGRKADKNGGNKMKTVMIDGIEYRSVESKGKRAVVVVDRGWIFAGDVEENGDRIILSNAVWVFRWSSIGFNGVLSDPKKADIKKMDHNIEIPKASEIFRIPVADGWGL